MGKKSNKRQNRGPSGGVMMNMRSGMRKVAGAGRKGATRKWSFQQVLGIVLGVAALLILVYVFTRV